MSSQCVILSPKFIYCEWIQINQNVEVVVMVFITKFHKLTDRDGKKEIFKLILNKTSCPYYNVKLS